MDELQVGELVLLITLISQGIVNNYLVVLVDADYEVETGVSPVDDLVLSMLQEVTLSFITRQALTHQFPF